MLMVVVVVVAVVDGVLASVVVGVVVPVVEPQNFLGLVDCGHRFSIELTKVAAKFVRSRKGTAGKTFMV